MGNRRKVVTFCGRPLCHIKESLKYMPQPIMLSQIQKKLDLRGLMKYAKEKGIKVEQLTTEEKNRFLL